MMDSQQKIETAYLKTLALLVADCAEREPLVVDFRASPSGGSPGGLYGRTLDLSQRLARSYGWSEEDAAGFLIKRLVPQIPAVVATLVTPAAGLNARIRLEVHPSLPPARVAAEYKRARKRLLGVERKRRLGMKNLQLVEFCVRYDEEPTWRACMAAWNRQCSRRRLFRWRYTEARRFKRDARASRQLLLVPWTPVGGKLKVSLEYSWE